MTFLEVFFFGLPFFLVRSGQDERTDGKGAELIECTHTKNANTARLILPPPFAPLSDIYKRSRPLIPLPREWGAGPWSACMPLPSEDECEPPTKANHPGLALQAVSSPPYRCGRRARAARKASLICVHMPLGFVNVGGNGSAWSAGGHICLSFPTRSQKTKAATLPCVFVAWHFRRAKGGGPFIRVRLAPLVSHCLLWVVGGCKHIFGVRR